MKTFPASYAKNNFGETLDTALTEPVEITKSGRVVAYMLSAKEYNRLVQCDQDALVSRALKNEESGYLSKEETLNLLEKLRSGIERL